MSKRRTPQKYIDPVPEPTPDFTNARYLEQVSLGRWIDDSPGQKLDEMRTAFNTLATYIAQRAQRFLFPHGASDDERQRFEAVLSASYERGFYLAVLRYRDDLRGNTEAMKFLQRRAAGGKKGRANQARAKADRVARIRAMMDQGVDPRDIARDVGCSISTVYRALTPANPKRKKRSRPTRRA